MPTMMPGQSCAPTRGTSYFGPNSFAQCTRHDSTRRRRSFVSARRTRFVVKLDASTTLERLESGTFVPDVVQINGRVDAELQVIPPFVDARVDDDLLRVENAIADRPEHVFRAVDVDVLVHQHDAVDALD